MRSFMVFALLAVAPLVVFGVSISSTATSSISEKPSVVVVKSDLPPALVESVVDSASPASSDAKHSPTESTPVTKQPAVNNLHRIPVFENRNPSIETITDFESHVNETLSEVDSHETETNKTSPELPIPARCPHITGTNEESLQKDGMLSLLESSRPKAAQRGCRFFIMHELMDRNQKHDEWAMLTAEQQMNQTLDKCFASCIHAYDNGTELNDACADGCQKTSKVTEAIKDYTGSLDDDSELEREQSSVPSSHRTFSIIIPIRPMLNSDKEDDEQSKDGSTDGFPSMMPNALKMVLNMMHQMNERVRQSMSMQQASQDGLGADQQTNGQSSMQESEMSIDPSGNSISISRSMSVLMTKDKEGHSKMVVVHTLPKVLIHHFGQNPFGEDTDDERHRLGDLLSGSSEHSTSSTNSDDDDADDLFGADNDQIHFKLFGHLSNAHNQHQHSGHRSKEEDDTTQSSTQVYYYRTRLCYYLPRLFYLTALILVLYVIFWLLCAVPQAIMNGGGRSSSANRRALPNGVAIIATSAGGNGKCRKFLFTKGQKYFQLNNKRNSTTSLPPPYPGSEDNDCAEPLPEKQGIPVGGLEVNGGAAPVQAPAENK